MNFGIILGGFWHHFGSQNAIKNRLKFWMRFWRPGKRFQCFSGLGPAECAGSLGGIIGGYKDAKIAGETRTRYLELSGLI